MLYKCPWQKPGEAHGNNTVQQEHACRRWRGARAFLQARTDVHAARQVMRWHFSLTVMIAAILHTGVLG